MKYSPYSVLFEKYGLIDEATTYQLPSSPKYYMAELKIPTETVTLPSKGLLYPETSPLSKGEIEMKYMTAKEEDILTNANYLKNGTAIDKLLQALIVTPIDYNELLIGDKNAILIAARILGYGKDYTINYAGREVVVDLTSTTKGFLPPRMTTTQKNAIASPATGLQVYDSTTGFAFFLKHGNGQHSVHAQLNGG